MNLIIVVTLLISQSLFTDGLFTCDVCDQGTFCYNNSLLLCPSNSHSASGSSNISDCICNAGFYSVSHECIACPVNTYCLGHADEKFSDCPLFTSSTIQSTSITDCVCNAGYTGSNGGPCTACVAGTYKTGLGSEPCQNCSLDTYSVIEASSNEENCIDCPTNFVSKSGSSSLQHCETMPGFFSKTFSEQDVQECPAGTYQPNIGMSFCYNCSATTYNTQTGSVSIEDCLACPSNSVVLNGPGTKITDCLCNAGYTGNAGAICMPCNAGTYKYGVNTAPCTSCAVDTYSPTVAMTGDFCIHCPSNSYSPAGSDSIGACVCGTAYENLPQTCSEDVCCVRCPSGFFKNDSMTQCLPCASNTYSMAETYCELCFDNSVSVDASDDVSDCVCKAGFQSSGVLSCEACAPGFFNAHLNASCLPCAVNTYSLYEQTITCVECTDNSLTLQSASTSADACLCNAGYESIDTECVLCAQGSYKSTWSSTDVCTVCPANTYSSPSRDVCLSCPDNSVSSSNSSSLTDCLCVAGYEPTSTSPHTCSECAVGFYKANDANNNCLLCALGYFASQTGAHQCVSCAENSYADALGSFECSACTNHSYSLASSTAATDCWCVAGYYFSGQQCVQCPIGTYKTTAHSLAQNQSQDFCHACATGQYTIAPGSTSVMQCLTCSANYYIATDGTCQWCGENAQSLSSSVGQHECQCNEGYEGDASTGLACTKCETGTYKSEPANNLCVFCAPGKVGLESGSGMLGILESRSCVLCVAGKYWSNFSCVDCPTNAISAEGASLLADCVCVAGFEQTQDVCEPCAVGHYSSEGGDCQLCPVNTFSDTVGSASCTLCPDHTSSNAGAVHKYDCLCNIGYFFNGSVCIACAPGTYKDVVSSVQQCTACGMHHYLPLSADGTADVCRSCPAFSVVPGYQGFGILSCVCDSGYIRANDTTCRECKQDHYCTTQYTEVACPSNSHSTPATADEVNCMCDAGYYGFGVLCTICPVNFFCPYETANPQACPPNASTVGVTGRQSIEDCVCDIGYYKEDNECHLCAKDSWCYANVKYNCPSNSSAVRGSSDVEDCKCDDGLKMLLGDHPNQECVPCADSVVCRGGEVEQCSHNAFNKNMKCVCIDGMYCQNTTNDNSCSGSDICQNCTEGHWCVDNVQHACAANEDLPPRSSAHTACRCKQGYYRSNGHCVISPVGFYTVDEVKFACTDFDQDLTTLHEGSYLLTQCLCQTGYYRTDHHDKCKPCPTNFYCPAEHQLEMPNVVQCPENEKTHDQAQSSIDSCFCLAGFKLTSQGGVVKCLACDIGELCSAGQVVDSLCHLENKMPNEQHTECVCMPGYGLVVVDCVACSPGFVKPLSGNLVCEGCPINHYSFNTTHCQRCPENSESRPASTSCECSKPYVWNSELGQCELCPVNTFLESAGVCTSCPFMSDTAGVAATVDGITACVCADGYVRHPINTSDGYMCSACPSNTYESDGVCIACPTNSVSLPNSSSINNCVCEGCHNKLVDATCAGICENAPANCTPCAPGYFKLSRSERFNQEICLACNHGFYQPANAATACNLCPVNEYHHVIAASSRSDCLCIAGYERNNETCHKCEPGHYKSHMSNDDCLVCSIGKFQALHTSTSCNSCISSTRNATLFQYFMTLENISNSTPYNPHPTFMSADTVSVASSSIFDCVCALGKESNNGVCTVCEPGSFKESVGLHDCRYCGSRIPGYGNTFVNTYGNSSEYGARSIEHCIHCPQFSGQDPASIGNLDDGFSFVMNDEGDCKCFPGHHQKTAAKCSNCSAYMIQPYYSDADCTFCPSGHYFVANNQLCTLCAIYTHNLSFVHTGIVLNSIDPMFLWATGESDCQCMLGFERIASNDGLCTPCAVGHYRNDNLTRNCQECAIDTFLPFQEGLHCLQCPLHSSTLNQTARTSITQCVCDLGYEWHDETETCEQCPAGEFRSEYTSASCQTCYANFYCPVGTIDPIQCPSKEVSSAGSSELNDCTCEIGSGRAPVSSQARKLCQLCPPGSFAPARSNFECTLCPANKNTSDSGATSIEFCKCIPGHGVSVSDDDAPCSPCLNGFFASGGQNIDCLHCGWGTITEPPTAAPSADSCLCDAGLGVYLV